MDVAVVLFLLLILCSIRRQGNEGGQELRGVLALVVLFHHLSLFVSGGVLLPLFREMGKPAVAVFLFLSGNGLMRRYRADTDYLQGFFGRRLGKIWMPYGIVALLSLLAWPLCRGQWFGLDDLKNAYVYGNPIVSNGWYVFFLAGCYLLFWLAAKTVRRSGWIVALLSAVMLAWIPLCRAVGWGDYWYASGPAFALGLAWGAWGRSIPWPLSLRSPVLSLVGEISYELYLVHGLLLLLLRRIVDGALLIGAVMVSSALLAYVIHHIIRKIKAGIG